MSLQSLSDQHLNLRRLMALTATAEVTRLWNESVDPQNVYRSWNSAIPQAASVLTDHQTRAAVDAESYIDSVLRDQGRSPEHPALVPESFAGFTYPTIGAPPRYFEESLQYPAFYALDGMRQGLSSSEAMARGRVSLRNLSASAVADGGRAADGVAIATEPQITGYIRQVEAEGCMRCVIFAGRVFHSEDAWERHPNCLCSHVPYVRNGEQPAPGDPYEHFEQLPESEQDRIFGEASAQAIRDGADIYQVVNARRGMSKADGMRGRTYEGMTRRGYASRAMRENGVSGPRLLPEAIYGRAQSRPAETRQEWITEQLTAYGYITGSQSAAGNIRETRTYETYASDFYRSRN